MNTDETPVDRFECPLDFVSYLVPVSPDRAPRVELRLEAILPVGHRCASPAQVGALKRGIVKRVLAKLNSQPKTPKTKLREAAGALSAIGALRSYTEKRIPRPGWYWYVPLPGAHLVSGSPRFVQVDEDNLKYDELHCRKYTGTYRGPIDMQALLGK